MPAEKLGKHKTAWQMLTIIYYLLFLATKESVPRGLSSSTLVVLNACGTLFLAVAVALTLFSGVVYLARHRDLFREN